MTVKDFACKKVDLKSSTFFPSKLYFCADKLRFPFKSHLANLESWGFFTSRLGKKIR